MLYSKSFYFIYNPGTEMHIRSVWQDTLSYSLSLTYQWEAGTVDFSDHR